MPDIITTTIRRYPTHKIYRLLGDMEINVPNFNTMTNAKRSTLCYLYESRNLVFLFTVIPTHLEY